MRLDQKLIQQWIEPGLRVLDLGCGDGALLKSLIDTREVHGLGVEIDPENLQRCVAAGLEVVEQDLNQGLANFPTDSFDVVVMAQALQTLRYPHVAIEEMLRVGKRCIVTFPNFGHWRSRWHLGASGRMPVSRFMPYTWYDTPNIHFCTVADFETLCRDRNIHVRHRACVGADNTRNRLASLWPNLFGVTAVYHISR